MPIISFIGIYLLLLSSIIGYGYFFANNILTYNKNTNIGYFGIYGIFILTLISYLTNLSISVNFFNNAFTSFSGTIFGPSDGALSGSSCVSIKIAPTPTAIAARAK